MKRGIGTSAFPRHRISAPELLEDRRLLAQTTGLFFNEPEASDGYTLFSPNTTTSTYLIDREANVVNQWTSNYQAGLLARLLPDGSLIRASSPTGQTGNGFINAAGAGGLLERFDWEGNKTWEFPYSGPTHLQHHDFEIMPNGNILLIAWGIKSESEATQAGRDPNLPGPGYLYPDTIVEVQPDYVNGGGDIVWEWHVWDHLVQQYDPTKENWHGANGVAEHPELININYVSTFDDGAGEPEDWTHANGIDYNAELDQILLSVREFSEFWIIDHSTTTAEAAGHTGGNSGKGGDLLYRWGNPETYHRGDDSDRVLFYQHDAKWVEEGIPGFGNITVFNNGFGRPGQDFSTVEELTPPIDTAGNYTILPGEAFGPTETVWTYTAPVQNFSAIISGTQRLENGNTLITFGVKGNMTEVTPEGEEVWKYVNPYTGGGQLGPESPIPNLGVSDPVLGTLFVNFTFKAVHYPADYLAGVPLAPQPRLFYNNSKFDGRNPAINAGDDAAIATDKKPYYAGSGLAQPENVTSYLRGINGVMIDMFLPGGTISADDFLLRVGTTNAIGSWAAAPSPSAVVVRSGAGAAGSDRVEIIWPDEAIRNTWLEVTIKGNDAAGGFNTDTGLAASEKFYFGSRVADSFIGSPPMTFTTGASDEIGARTGVLNAPIDHPYDFNRDGLVNATDSIGARLNGGFMLRLNLPSPSPLAAPQTVEGRRSALAAALAVLTHDDWDERKQVSWAPQIAAAEPAVSLLPNAAMPLVMLSDSPNRPALKREPRETEWDSLLESLL